MRELSLAMRWVAESAVRLVFWAGAVYAPMAGCSDQSAQRASGGPAVLGEQSTGLTHLRFELSGPRRDVRHAPPDGLSRDDLGVEAIRHQERQLQCASSGKRFVDAEYRGRAELLLRPVQGRARSLYWQQMSTALFAKGADGWRLARRSLSSTRTGGVSHLSNERRQRGRRVQRVSAHDDDRRS
jgi:hypothetical protein